MAFYVLFRPFLSKKQIYLALFLFYSMNYVGQDYLSPQSVAYLLFLAFLALTFVYIIRAPSMTMQYPTVATSSLLFIIFLSLVVTHFLTSLALLLFFVVFAFSARIIEKVRLNRFVVPYVVAIRRLDAVRFRRLFQLHTQQAGCTACFGKPLARTSAGGYGGAGNPFWGSRKRFARIHSERGHLSGLWQ